MLLATSSILIVYYYKRPSPVDIASYYTLFTDVHQSKIGEILELLSDY